MRLFVFIATVLASLGSAAPAQSNILKILPLGDSITECREGDASYRYYLWNQLRADGQCVDFVGNQTGVRQGQPKYPNFDQHHEGHWGWRTDEILAQIPTWAATAQPDVVLCHLGTNDLWQGQDVASTIVEMGQLIDALRAVNPRVHFLFAEIIPVGPSFSVNVVPLNNAFVSLAANKHTSTSPVILVDHFTGWDPNVHTYDGVHTNDAGSQRMANTWYQALVDAKLSCRASLRLYGTGCAGSAGTPTLTATVNQTPIIGKPFWITLASLPANALVTAEIGFSDTSIGGAPLPMNMGFLGMPGCTLFIDPQWPTSLQADSSGIAYWSLGPIPNAQYLVGIRFYIQAFVHDAGANAMGVTTTNGAAGLIGTR